MCRKKKRTKEILGKQLTLLLKGECDSNTEETRGKGKRELRLG